VRYLDQKKAEAGGEGTRARAFRCEHVAEIPALWNCGGCGGSGRPMGAEIRISIIELAS
jgi:hypothetical protein